MQEILPTLQNYFPDLVCVTANVQPIAHSILEGNEEIFLTRETQIDYLIDGLALKLSPRAFVQTNFEVASRLYESAARWTRDISPQKIMELYAGQGAFSFFIARELAGQKTEILGIELNADAVESANQTATRLGLSAVKFKCMDARHLGQEMSKLAPDLVLVNPPRKGLGEGIQSLLAQLPRY